MKYDESLRQRQEIPESVRDLPFKEEGFWYHVAEQLQGECVVVEKTLPESQMWCLQ